MPSLSGGAVFPVRFIPTWVGNAAGTIDLNTANAVHPHVGGECIINPSTLNPVGGSSPRGWGMLVLGGDFALPARFIPTWVGNANIGPAHRSG